MNQRSLEFLQSLLVPVVSIVAGAAVAAFKEWQGRRSETGRRKLTLEDARAQVAFVSEWSEAFKGLGLSPATQRDLEQRAGSWLLEASERVAAHPLPPPRTDSPGVWRRVLLGYRLESPGARVARGAFHLLLGWTPIVLGAAASNRSLVPGFAKIDLLIAVGAVVLGACLRALALAIERHEAARATATGPAHGWFRTIFLVHPLAAPAARRGRVVMYLLIAALPADLINYLVFLDRQPTAARPFLPLTIGGLMSIIAAVVGMRSWTLYREQRHAGAAAHDVDQGIVELTLPGPIPSDPTIADASANPQAVTT